MAAALAALVWAVPLAKSTANACFLKPPDVMVVDGKDGAHALRRFNRTGRVEVFHKEAPQKVVWATDLAWFSDLFSQVVLAEKGRLVLHVRGNHMVRHPRSAVVEAHTEEGMRWALTAEELMDELVVVQHPSSADPRERWLKTFVLDRGNLLLTTADDRRWRISLATGKVVPDIGPAPGWPGRSVK